MTNLAQFEMLVNKIPTNSLGMLEGIYRPDLLPHSSLLDLVVPINTPARQLSGPSTASDHQHSSPNPVPNSITEQMNYQHSVIEAEKELRAAYVPLAYHEGFPTLDGRPFWAALPFEDNLALQCFEAYLRLPIQRRQLWELQQSKDIPPVTMNQLLEWYHLYYWGYRAHAFDLFYAAARRRQRQNQAQEVEDDNFKIACKLADIAEDYIDGMSEEFIEMLTPKTLIELVKVSTQLQRISVGLPMNGPSPASAAMDDVEGMTVKQITQRLVDKGNLSIDKLTDGGGTTININSETNNQVLANLMADPQALALAQELIIRMSGGDPNKTFDQRHAIHPDSVAKDIGLSTKQVVDLEVNETQP